MPQKHQAQTEEGYAEVGRRHSSDNVAKEASVAVKRWKGLSGF